MWGFSSLIPVITPLVKLLCDDDIGLAAFYIGMITGCYSLTTMIGIPVMGVFSDVYGRRPVLLVALIALSIDLVGMILAFELRMLWILFISRSIAGLGNGFLAISMASLADLSKRESRSKNFGLSGVSMGSALILGPLASIFFGRISLSIPLVVGLVVVGVNLIFVVVALPETTSEKAEFRWKKAIPMLSFSMLRKTSFSTLLSIVFFLVWLGEDSLIDIYAIYFTYRLGWGIRELGILMMLVGILFVFSQGVILRIALRFLGDRKALILALVINTISCTMYGLATEEWHVYSIMGLRAISMISSPILQGMLSRNFAAYEQGELLGVLGSIKMFANLVTPFIMTNLFAYFISDDAPIKIPGIVFYIASCLFVIAIGISLFAFRRNTEEMSRMYSPLPDRKHMEESEESDVEMAMNAPQAPQIGLPADDPL